MSRSASRTVVRPVVPADPDAVATRRRRAVEEPLDVRWRSREPVVELEVRNPIHRTRYRVVFPAYPLREAAMCTCTDFARRGLGTCKHLEAGWSWLERGPEPAEVSAAGPPRRTAGELWKEIDRRLESLSHSGPAQIRDVEGPGALLFEEGPGPGAGEGGVGEATGRPRSGRPGPTPTSRGRS